MFANYARFTDAGLAFGFVILWSSGFIGAELGTQASAALTLLAWRAIVATAILVLLRRDRRRITGREAITQSVIGLLAQGGYLLGVVLAVDVGVPAGTVALVAALQPIASALAAGPALGERVTARQWAALVVGLAGVGLVVGSDMTMSSDAPPWAYVLPFLAMASLVVATLLERRMNSSVDVVDSLTIQTGATAGAFIAIGTGSGTLLPPVDGAFWVAVMWTVVLSHLGGYAFYWLNARRGGAVRVGVLLYLTPPATSVWAWAMFGDAMTILDVVGMVACLASVMLFLVKPSAERVGSRS